MLHKVSVEAVDLDMAVDAGRATLAIAMLRPESKHRVSGSNKYQDRPPYTSDRSTAKIAKIPCLPAIWSKLY